MNRLRTDLAPVTDAAWVLLTGTATRTLEGFLAGRRLVEFDGPHGWGLAAVPTGRAAAAVERGGVTLRARQVRPLLELQAEFSLSLAELEVSDRGGADPDLSPLVDAARRIALTEDALVFYGEPGLAIPGIATASPHPPVPMSDDYAGFPSRVAAAVATLRRSGVGGPYALALGERCYAGVVETTEHGGFPVLEHLRLITGGPLVWAPAVEGSVVLSVRGGDYRLHVGADLAVGYRSHDGQRVTLYLEESLTFSADGPEAAVALVYGEG